jgi:hypothetical protein
VKPTSARPPPSRPSATTGSDGSDGPRWMVSALLRCFRGEGGGFWGGGRVRRARAARANEFAATTTRRPPSRTGGSAVRSSTCHVASSESAARHVSRGIAIEFSPFSRAVGRGAGERGPFGRQPKAFSSSLEIERQPQPPPAVLGEVASLSEPVGAPRTRRDPSVARSNSPLSARNERQPQPPPAVLGEVASLGEPEGAPADAA